HQKYDGLVVRGRIDEMDVDRVAEELPDAAHVRLDLRIDELAGVDVHDIAVAHDALAVARDAARLEIVDGMLVEHVAEGFPGDVVEIDAAPVLALGSREHVEAPWLVGWAE